MYKIKVRNYENKKIMGSYSFKTKKEGLNFIDAICKQFELKKMRT